MAVRIDPPRRIEGTNDYYYRYLCGLVKQIEYELNERDRVIAELSSVNEALAKQIKDLSAETADEEGEN